jgi:hypothetical protein
MDIEEEGLAKNLNAFEAENWLEPVQRRLSMSARPV